MGHHVLDAFEHPTPLFIAAAYFTILALQDLRLSAGLVAAVFLLLLDLICTLLLRTTRRLKLWPYALQIIFLVPLGVWLIIYWWNRPRANKYFNVAFHGGVFVLMALSVIITMPFVRDFMREKSPRHLWNQGWFKSTAYTASTIWSAIFLSNALVALIPLLTGRHYGMSWLNVIFNYIWPIWSVFFGFILHKSLQERTRNRQLGTTGHGEGTAYNTVGTRPTGPYAA